MYKLLPKSSRLEQISGGIGFNKKTVLNILLTFLCSSFEPTSIVKNILVFYIENTMLPLSFESLSESERLIFIRLDTVNLVSSLFDVYNTISRFCHQTSFNFHTMLNTT